jgi:hypothetical protein
MRFRVFWLILIFPVATALPAGQNTFPHPIGDSATKIEYLYKSHLPDGVKKAIVELVFEKSSASDCVFPGRTEQQEIDLIRVASTKLSAQGTDLLVQASDRCNCGATGNCSFWVLHERQNDFDILLKTFLVQQFSVEPSRSNGFRDLITASHGSAFLQGLVLYQFDGKQYRATQCATAEYHLSDQKKDGHETVSDEPTISPAKPCGPD